MSKAAFKSFIDPLAHSMMRWVDWILDPQSTGDASEQR
jgi:hypothetical protein